MNAILKPLAKAEINILLSYTSINRIGKETIVILRHGQARRGAGGSEAKLDPFDRRRNLLPLTTDDRSTPEVPSGARTRWSFHRTRRKRSGRGWSVSAFGRKSSGRPLFVPPDPEGKRSTRPSSCVFLSICRPAFPKCQQERSQTLNRFSPVAFPWIGSNDANGLANAEKARIEKIRRQKTPFPAARKDPGGQTSPVRKIPSRVGPGGLIRPQSA